MRFLKLLLSRRANWLQKDLEEMTPLHLATRHPSQKALALLLKHIGPGEVDTQDKNKVLQYKHTQIGCLKIDLTTVQSLSEAFDLQGDNWPMTVCRRLKLHEFEVLPA